MKTTNMAASTPMFVVGLNRTTRLYSGVPEKATARARPIPHPIGGSRQLLRSESLLPFVYGAGPCRGDGLDKGHTEKAGDCEADEVAARGLAQVELQRSAEQEDHREREDHGCNEPAGVAKELQDVAAGD